jgi:hypothetical protein
MDAAKSGLPGEHHFYIAFDTQAPGVKLSARLREQYPQEMTIILQHQFWDLVVNNEGFEVGLSFGGVPERLAVPFDAIKGFYDPSVQFGLQFEAQTEAAAESEATTDKALPKPVKKAAASDAKPENIAPPAAKPAAEPPAAAPPSPREAEPQPQSTGADVVSLDRFRKK